MAASAARRPSWWPRPAGAVLAFGWLRPPAARCVRRGLRREHRAGRFGREPSRLGVGQRDLELTRQSLALLGRDTGTDVIHPLLDPEFLRAICGGDLAEKRPAVGPACSVTCSAAVTPTRFCGSGRRPGSVRCSGAATPGNCWPDGTVAKWTHRWLTAPGCAWSGIARSRICAPPCWSSRSGWPPRPLPGLLAQVKDQEVSMPPSAKAAGPRPERPVRPGTAQRAGVAEDG